MFQVISVEGFTGLLSKDQVTIADIRDRAAFESSHIDGARHLSVDNISEFIKTNAKTLPLVIYCNRGRSSMAVAQCLVEEGFESVYSLTGGYQSWCEYEGIDITSTA